MSGGARLPCAFFGPPAQPRACIAQWRKAPRRRGAIDPQEMGGEREGSRKKEKTKVENKLNLD